MENEISEIAKATQEVAKTARTGIEAAQSFGGFLARVFGEPIETAVGMFSDRLKFMRFAARYDEIMNQRGLNSAEQPVPPKIGIPAIESASLEENNELQDLWANLLASAHDPGLNGVVRSAFVDIIKQLEIVDVHVLNYAYTKTLETNQERGENDEWMTKYKRDIFLDPVKYPVPGRNIRHDLNISNHAYECAVDNLVRVRCLAPYIEDVDIHSDEFDDKASFFHEYEYVAITSLGWDFVRSCTLPTEHVKRAS